MRYYARDSLPPTVSEGLLGASAIGASDCRPRVGHRRERRPGVVRQVANARRVVARVCIYYPRVSWGASNPTNYDEHNYSNLPPPHPRTIGDRPWHLPDDS